ncbi:MAG: hypothetical protein Q7J84_18885 [Sulfuricaulis sp.]|nr:hypothetical protein [Sulfuricaulis sp.]
MTDLEITRLCAAAVGETWRSDLNDDFLYEDSEGSLRSYTPLHDDAQAMALVKKMSIQIHHHGYAGGKASLTTVSGRMKLDDHPTKVCGTDLNRAICECVAKMQAAK